MKKLFLLLPLLGLTSCVAPKDSADASASNLDQSKPVYRSSRFGVGVGYSEQAAEAPKETAAEKKLTPTEVVVPAPVSAEATPTTVRKPLFSFLSKKPATAALPKATAAAPKVSPTPAAVAPPVPRKPFFSFLMKNDPPKALVVAQPSVKKPAQAAQQVKNVPAELPKRDLDDDDLRLPDMLTMPEKNEFESTNPSAGKSPGGGAVIARPPTDPPSRPKIKGNP